jgi:hypothetical protein
MSSSLLRVFASATAVGSALFFSVAVVEAAPCGRPDVDLTFPPNNATSVPNNALFAAHYASPALYNDEAVTLTDAAGNDVAVTVTYDDAESTLHAAPDQTLGDGSHRIDWPGLRGVSGGGLGRGRTTNFFVQSTTDAAPPTFAGLIDIDWDLARDRDPCLDRLDDRFVFRLKVGAASDDVGAELLALQIFETRDPLTPDQTGPTKVGVRGWPADGSVEVRRPAGKAGQTCFAAVVQDLLGNVSGGGEREVCIKTQKPPFFDGCSLSPRGVTPGASASKLWFLLALIGLRRRGRGQSAKARPTRPA